MHVRPLLGSFFVHPCRINAMIIGHPTSIAIAASRYSAARKDSRKKANGQDRKHGFYIYYHIRTLLNLMDAEHGTGWVCDYCQSTFFD